MLKICGQVVDKVMITFFDKIAFCSFMQTIGVQGIGFLFVLPLYLGYCVLVKESITPGDFVATFNGAHSVALSFQVLTVWVLSQFSEQAKMIEKYREFLGTKPKIKDGKKVAPKLSRRKY